MYVLLKRFDELKIWECEMRVDGDVRDSRCAQNYER